MNRHNQPKWRRYSAARAAREEKRRKTHSRSRKIRNLRPSTRGPGKIKAARPPAIIFNRVSATNPLSLFDNFPDTNEFFKKLEDAFQRHNEVNIDINDVDQIGIESILVLLALIKRYSKSKPRLRITGNSPKVGTQAAQMLYDSGYYEQFHSIYAKRVPTENVCRMLQRKGFKVATDLASEMALDAGEAIFGKRHYPLGVYPTLIEAMGNTREHANPGEDASIRWWTLFYIDKAKARACFIIYDGGIGILGSLRSRFETWFSSLGVGASEEDILHDIMHGKHKSRTNLPYRGKGLPAMAKAVERKQIYKLRVLSNKVLANIDLDKYVRLPSDFKGTLLSWEVVKI